MCPDAFIGLIFCGFGVLLWRFGEDFVVRRPVLLGDHPQPKYVQRSRLLTFGWAIQGASETYEGIQVRAGVRVVLPLLQSDRFFSTEVLAVFYVDTIVKKILKNFFIIFRYMSYFVIFWFMIQSIVSVIIVKFE